MTTMRERLCLAAVRAELEHAGATLPETVLRSRVAIEEAVNVFGGFVDAFLAELRTPDAAMIEAGGGGVVNLERADDPSYEPAEIFTAMIDHVLKPD